MSTLPLLSIVSVTRNDARRLQRTLGSIASQGGGNFEYIVVDGASTDETLSILESAEKAGVIDRWISEPDVGIFDAMNKGAQLARGEWLVFINAGDELYDKSVIARLSDILLQYARCDYIIGAVEHVYPGGYRKVRQPKALDLRWGMRFSHQATVVKTSYQKENPFVLSDGIAADYGFFLRAVCSQASMAFTHLVIARFYIDGISSIDYSENVRRERKLYQKYTGKTSLVFPCRWLYCRVAKSAKNILPTGLVNWVQGLK